MPLLATLLFAVLLQAALLQAGLLQAQQPAVPVSIASERPLPDIPTLMHEVEANQRALEVMQQKYIYKSSQTFERLNGKGDVKKTETVLYEVFWLSGVEVSREIERDGIPLTPEQQKKQNERIDKEAVKLRARRDKADAKGEQTDGRGHTSIQLSRFLALGLVSNPRRELLDGRPTILLDFTGDPKAKAQDPFELIVRDLVGTLAIDEQDKVLARLDATLINNFKVAGGLVASISKGTRFRFTDRKINDEVWLPASVEGNGHIRFFLFVSIDGDFHLQTSDYRKFKATTTILPGFTELPPETPPIPPPPKP